jgi:DNA-directed RNA polymerase subunit beta'
MIDRLRGLKENVIMGRIIPAGTGIVQHQDDIVELYEGVSEDDTVEAPVAFYDEEPPQEEVALMPENGYESRHREVSP